MKRKSTRRGRRTPSKTRRTAAQYFAKFPRQRASVVKAAHALTTMRTHGLSLDAAAREAGTTPKTVRRYAGSALHKTKPGKYRVRATDTMLRSLVIPRNGGLAEIVTRDSRSASIVAQYANAVQAFLQTGDEPELQRFRGLQIVDAEGNHITLLTDLDELERLGAFGALSFESLYAKVR